MAYMHILPWYIALDFLVARRDVRVPMRSPMAMPRWYKVKYKVTFERVRGGCP